MTDSQPQVEEERELLTAGHARLSSGDPVAAKRIADQLLETGIGSAPALTFASDAYFAIAGFHDSARLAERCLDRHPENLAAAALLCRAQFALGKIEDARGLAHRLAGEDLTDSHHIEMVVTVLMSLFEADLAYPLCRQSVDLEPEKAATWRRMALVCRTLGKSEEAEAAANAALRLDPHDYEMIGLRSSLRPATSDSNHLGELTAVLKVGCRNTVGAAKVAYALAKEHDDLGNFTRSFQYLEAGARFRREGVPYQVADDVAMMTSLEATFTAKTMAAAPPGFETTEPVFILGLPRTGSTLVERILSSHSDIYAAGELNHFAGAMMAAIRKDGPPKDRMDLIHRSIGIDMKAAGEHYLTLTRPKTGETPHFIDKLPLNSLNIGIIHMALPNARIIHLRRTPMDACYAIYKFLFNMAYPWSYDLGDIATFYAAYRGLMDHWHRALPGRILDITYEDVVADLDGEARKMVSALDLEWEPACLRFHENQADAMTGSASQVRQQIYASSVGNWRHYEKELQPLAAALEAAGIDPFTP